MAKSIFTTTFLLLLQLICFSQSPLNKNIHDGLYLIVSIDSEATPNHTLSANELAIGFSPMFAEFNPKDVKGIVVDTTRFVPLDLEKPPVTEQQTDLKKKLLLSLTQDAAEQLNTFTTKYLMHMVALVVGGEALTMHKIKAPITNGQLQISRCSDNACEKLLIKLKENLK